MSKQPQSLKQTLQLIADILSFDCPHEQLEEDLKSGSPDWDAVVIIGSRHLMLPAIYCRLQQKNLLKYLPNELIEYLTELTDLNRDRNKVLLQEAQQISHVFTQHQIEHLFIKGIALIGGNYYQDIAERMIGDIDVLVASEHLEKAFELLVSEGYSRFIKFNYEVKNYRHCPRQISDNHLGAVELHGQLLKHGFNHLISKKSFFSNRQLINHLTIPSTENLILNAIYAHQINDNNSFLCRINFKAIYDILVVKVEDEKNLIDVLSQQSHGVRFLSLASVFFPALKPNYTYDSLTSYKCLFLLSLNFPRFGYLLYKLKFISLNLSERIKLFMNNKSYRKHSVKKLGFK